MVALPVRVEKEYVELSDERIPGNILVWGADELAVHRHAVAVPLPRVDRACSDGTAGQNQCFRSGSGSRRTKMTHKSRKKLRNFMFKRARCFLMRAEGFFCILDVLSGGLWIGNL
jgi:hypothetical protein